jgi:hypothetical protein
VLEIIDLLIPVVEQLVALNRLNGLTRFYFDHADPRRRTQVVSSATIALALLPFAVAGSALLAADRDSKRRSAARQSSTASRRRDQGQARGRAGAE